jgi:hypothetical protein
MIDQKQASAIITISNDQHRSSLTLNEFELQPLQNGLYPSSLASQNF